MSAPKATFIGKIIESIQKQLFVKLILSRHIGEPSDLKKIQLKLVHIKGVDKLSFHMQYEQRDEVKNYSIEEGIVLLEVYLGNHFLNGNLFTLERNYNLLHNKKRKARLLEQKPTHLILPDKSHDRTKKRFVHTDKIYLQEMGIASKNGQILKQGQAKYRQINKYIEIVDHLIQKARLKDNIRILDMGSGKGYLTFALYDYLKNTLQFVLQLTGIELRSNLVDFCNRLATKIGFEQLDFVASDIFDYQVDDLDILIALHACDTATDIAIAKGIQSGAKIIIVAPCCHKQIRKAMKVQSPLKPILEHGILLERQAELITDGIRALLLEQAGYQTKVFEFISSEHTAKNLMITAIKTNQKSDNQQAIENIKNAYGIQEHYLESLLK